ncbi:hypothetical protein [Neptuniibacter sp. CAU 1671]|uniref:hypothetical protein n=1 Tax=Neptuniibacter sp. CAU 1671 TaxID=3032593 RepID=UPI0023DADD6E|nr:hypothetical protein [Neptuniibacter sp. CAU 1671]MDF2181737.1 hypothetical protein [Neptuniibacter sp. CAU 1671]
MKIAQSQIQLSANTSQSVRVRTEETLQITRSGAERTTQVSQTENTESVSLLRQQALSLELYTGRQQAANTTRPPAAASHLAVENTQAASDSVELSAEEKLKIELIQRIYHRLTGKEMSFSLTAYHPGQNEHPTSPNTPSASTGLFYSYRKTREQTDQLNFNATAQVITSDGRTLNLDLQLNMERHFAETVQFELRAGAALKDPLIINLHVPSAELTTDTLSFDLDSDGQQETIHRLAEGSGYLVLDRNNNGRVDNGSELFGVESGNGFADLAVYDQDNNGFIDEADAIWQKLRIWIQPDQTTGQLGTLAENGVGALYLGYSATPWDLGGGEQTATLAGRIASTGIYLTENGQLGTLQQVDLVV